MSRKNRPSTGLRRRRAKLKASRSLPRLRRWALLAAVGLAGSLAISMWPPSETRSTERVGLIPSVQVDGVPTEPGVPFERTLHPDAPSATLLMEPAPEISEQTQSETDTGERVAMAVPLEVPPPPTERVDTEPGWQPHEDVQAQPMPSTFPNAYTFDRPDPRAQATPPEVVSSLPSDLVPQHEQVPVLNPQLAPAVAVEDTGWAEGVEQTTELAALEYVDIQLPERDVDLPEVPNIDFTTQTAEEALAVVNGVSGDRKWIAVFFLGEQVGHHYGLALENAAWFSEQLAGELRGVFYNGLAHTAPWDISDPEGQAASIDEHVPEAYRKNVYLGVLIRFASVHGDNPGKVVAFARRFGSKHGVNEIDGVRIGIQLRNAQHPARALALVQRYPPDFQEAMVEEIGWRVGSEVGLDPGLVVQMAAGLAESSRPRFFHGACRSAWTPRVPLSSLRPLLVALDAPDREQCLLAVGFSLAQLGRTPAEVRVAAADLGEPEWMATLVLAHASFEEDGSGWLNPDLVRPGVP